jgi:FAD/FMN-containing dehydrogenase
VGTSWQGTSVRDGGMLIDLSRLTDVRVDPDSRTASVQPGGRGRELNNLLEPHG